MPKLAGPWRLVFSGPSKVAFLSYIPVDEDFVINIADSSLALESDLGPFRAKFKGQYKWRADSNEMDFAFNLAQVYSPAFTNSACPFSEVLGYPVTAGAMSRRLPRAM